MKKHILLLALTFFSSNLIGQILTPVKWSYASKKINDKKAVVFIKAEIDDGWHIYSIKQKDGGPIKTTVQFLNSKNYTLIGKLVEPKPENTYEKNFKMDVYYFEKSVIFQQKINLKTNNVMVKGKLTFMVCNKEKCLPPEEIVFNIKIE